MNRPASTLKRFPDPAASRALFEARECAFRDGASLIEDQHLLQGILCVVDARFDAFLDRLEITRDRLRALVPPVAAERPRAPFREIPFSDDVRRALDIAVETAERDRRSVELGHFLLGIVDSKGAVGSRLAGELNLDAGSIRAALRSDRAEGGSIQS